ncbi:MAG: hydroxyacid dehydrogenase [Ardenticatenaceae bacterium]|nr:hydroxyacid dehydrogenase [Anaerolineales bacterium]MCB8922006.1 hydroxyacid dehydrogenase [Ardenticatenaceae bacterium]MCB8989582.1 hydroxyacid dehydrogenase [Ardenticatenaceae bacterium]MCB9003125.1 hydroxyacid dehydrogenase [Ardenticatenaceae bacterium]
MTPQPQPRILICDPIAAEGVALLREFADVDISPNLSSTELLAVIGSYEAMIVRSATRVSRAVIEQAQKLKVIGRAGSGLDTIDTAVAAARGIAVVNSPDANTLAVAEHTLALMLALARRLPRADWGLKAGKWEKKQFMGTGLAGKTLGLIGFGRIGRQVAVRARAFDMKILVNQRRFTPELGLAEGVTAVDLLDLLPAADFVSLHLPFTPDTAGMIGAAQLALMKTSAYLINTARGGLIDEDALLSALDDGRIAGAALDVFASEPAIDSKLAQHERVIATPHIAASTVDAQVAAAVTIAEKIREVLEG